MDSFFTDQHTCLAVVQDSVVYFWSVLHNKNSSGCPLPNTETNGLEISESPFLTYKPQLTTCSITSIQWDPRSCKLAIIDNFGSAIYFQRLFTKKNHGHNKNTSEIITFDLASQNYTVTCIAFPQRSGRYLAVGISTGLIHLYKCRIQISFHSQLCCNNITIENSSSNEVQPRCITWLLNDRVIAAGYNNGSIVLFLAASSTPTGECENFVLPFPSDSSNHNSYSPPACTTLKTFKKDNTLLCCGYSDGSIILWNIQWPIIGDTRGYILNHWNPKSSTTTNVKKCEYYVVDIALFSDRSLFSVGAPDMNLRMWSISSSCSKPIKTLSPIDEQHGYLSVDIASNTSILATGLVNGNIWFYNVHDFSSPIRCIYFGLVVPVRLLSFAFTSRSSDEVKFSSPESTYHTGFTLQNENYDAKSHGNSALTHSAVNDTSSSSRQPLCEVTNVITKSQPETWASLLREFSVPELSLHSDSSLLPSSDQDSIKLSWLEVNPDNLENILSFKSELNKDDLSKNQQTESIDHHNIEDTVDTNSVKITHEWLDQYFSVRFRSMMSDLNWSHNELLFKFTKLEWKFDQMCEQFRSVIAQMKHENDLLRFALNRHSQI
ncbi:hypothetical protein MN116_007959 [Schistosoma mekongi]|uniref:Uncharacterized protein n=1 Tax=Schistosoma mekongi TaxID=38744 RepID=A0AAE2D2A4_SCHME|nr:hypothetical protein MN116_007959 [Schistosoma mekongi]